MTSVEANEVPIDENRKTKRIIHRFNNVERDAGLKLRHDCDSTGVRLLCNFFATVLATFGRLSCRGTGAMALHQP